MEREAREETENGEWSRFFTLLFSKFLRVVKGQILSMNADSVISHRCP